jgi:hypothetical protein
MKSLLTSLSVLLLLAATAHPASAWFKHKKKDGCAGTDDCGQGCGPQMCGPQGCGPQAYGPHCGVPFAPPGPPVMPQGYGWAPPPGLFGPPPFPPFQGVLPAGNRGPQISGCPLPQHPYARSPRDFFMYGDRDNNGNRP